MLDVVFPFIGGLGLFLIGMMLLSEGLVAFAGGSLQKALLAFTGRPVKAFISGALITALAQSSTATTVTLIGFVSAGLISFVQAIGVLIGASLGNTATGWIVATLGLKVNLGFYTLPLIGVGALLRLLAKGQARQLGLALAGFAMLFLGLSMLQDGMQGLAGMVNFSRIPTGGYGAYLIIVLIGLVLTGALQSSTAAIAMTLTALDAGAISFDQAAAVVIGAAIGTTMTGVLVSIGGTIYAKRTAVAYILFNVAAGLIGLLLLPLFLRALYSLSAYMGFAPGAIALAAFHSLFIAFGALLFLPFTHHFAALVERLLPERQAELEHHLDISMLSLPTVALEASQDTIEDLARKLLVLHGQMLDGNIPASGSQMLQHADALLNEAYEFLVRVQLPVDNDDMHQRLSAQLHAIDHLLRLRTRLDSMLKSDVNFDNSVYHSAVQPARAMSTLALRGLQEKADAGWIEQLAGQASLIAGQLEQVRSGLLAGLPVDHDAKYSLRTTDVYRWLGRTAHHIWRVSHYLDASRAVGAADSYTDPITS